MKHDPADFARSTPDASQDEKDRRIEALLATLPPCPGVPSTEEEVEAAEARAHADIAGGRVHSHAIVGEWLRTSGDADYKPFKEWLATRNG